MEVWKKEHDRKITLGPVTGRGLQNGKCKGGGGGQVKCYTYKKGSRIFFLPKLNAGGGGGITSFGVVLMWDT